MDPTQRLTEIKRNNLCINCFAGSHSLKNCKSMKTCAKCNRRHHTLLHRESETQRQPTDDSFPKHGNSSTLAQPSTSHFISSNSPNGVIQSCFASSSSGILLGTAVVNILHQGEIYRARALLDTGSEGSFISEKLSNLLKLPVRRTSAMISGLNNSISASVQKESCFVLVSDTVADFEIAVSALVVPHLSNNLPSRTISTEAFSNLPQLQLADPRFYESAKIDILLGADVLPSVMLSRNQHRICGSLMAQETVFGWILTGPVAGRESSCFTTCVSYFCEVSLDRQISRFWEVENVPQKRFPSQNDKYCDELYSKTTRRTPDGRYVVLLPFKESYPEEMILGSSRKSALAQFFRNEARLLRNPDLKHEYDESLEEYITLKHMSPIYCPDPLNAQSNYYLPHHAVVKPERTTTKVRVVFNASCPTSNGLSLNDVLHTGPVLQNDLTLLILRWRFYQFVLNGDIQKMYRQILVHQSHTPFQRILFRKTPNEQIQDFELKTATFGLNCAPYLANRTMIQLANDVQDKYPLASQILRSYMYVDDALFGDHSIQKVIDARNQLIDALAWAGFSIRKWISNRKSILEGLPADSLLYADFLEFEDRSSAKTLGIRWNALSDAFYFTPITFSEDPSYTNREVLSQISKLFDPAGWLSPIVIVAKILMQRIWMERTDWDSVISPDSLVIWKTFQNNYPFIEKIRIPRWINFSPEGEVEFHGFSDASEKAYSAAIYIRVTYPNAIDTRLVTSKTKVAPLKTLSIPRLELCGATLLAEMFDHLIPNFDVQNYTIFCWTDSSIVLSWLSKPPCCWTTFVANRVSKITQVVESSRWFHVDSRHNPADIASRGYSLQELLKCKLWWEGPNWLSKPSKDWPKFSKETIDETQLEKKSLRVHFLYFQDFHDILDRFSSFSRPLRVVSYIYRFYFATHPKLRSNYKRDSLSISTAEILFVRKQLISTTQKAYYPNEYMSLHSKKSIPSSSPLLCLNPFMDPEGIMRVCGRLESSPGLSYQERHPIIIPYNCQYSRLVVEFTHQICLHGGNQLVLRLVRMQYWIPKVQNLIKSIIHKCKPCILYKRKCQKQLMAALPPERCELSRPFAHTGLDFAGPFEIKSYAGRCCRISKGYVCLFVCFATKAIHLEATSDLSTSTFLAAFNRFVSRRGCPLHLHSDNGTTFVGASKILAKEFIQTSRQAVTSHYAHQNITWHFIPPGAPHMGGLWEAGVKSFKLHFKKTAGIHKYTFEEFQTLLSKIEACLNSRPISPNSQNPSDLAALTPGHFLIGCPILVPLEPEISQSSISIQNRWQKLRALYQQGAPKTKYEPGFLFKTHPGQKIICLQGLSSTSRVEVMLEVQKNEFCGKNGSYGSCFSKTGCGYCHKRHHSLLHVHTRLQQSTSNTSNRSKERASTVETPSTSSSSASACNARKQPANTSVPTFTSLTAILKQNAATLLPTALVKIGAKDGKHTARCLFDSASKMSCISKRFVEKFSLLTLELDNEIICPVTLWSCVDSNFMLETTLRVNNRITTITPKKTLFDSVRTHFNNLMLADKYFYKASTIDIVLGVDVLSRVVRDGIFVRAGLHKIQHLALFYTGTFPPKDPFLYLYAQHSSKLFFLNSHTIVKLSKQKKYATSSFSLYVHIKVILQGGQNVYVETKTLFYEFPT
ncbi:uncharacterized protein LOC142239804 [Haematobia irritans]|uniref:uncharacterized protein LOC142239804 n=1 Tax=Haematobia irritans TaxID=7368 RepID=UPI003F4FE18A